MADLSNLHDKWVLITGAATGIGFSTATAFARRGAHSILIDVNAEQLEAAAGKLRALDARCLHLACDVSQPASVAECAALLEKEGITPDVLVNNAGIAFFGGFLETPIEKWQQILDVNVLGIVHMIRAFLPAMKATTAPRCIVNIASTAAYLPAPNMSAYAASKGAVKLLNEVLAMELAGSNVRLQCVYPGIINTAIVGGVKSMGANITEAQLKKLQRYYVDHGCSPNLVGDAIVAAVTAGADHVYAGPFSRLGNLVARFSPALARRLSLNAARTSGYL